MRQAQDAQQALPLPEQTYTLVIELDAWNIRERDGWGQSAQRRAAGQELQRWHLLFPYSIHGDLSKN
jgi:hypothetical protein